MTQTRTRCRRSTAARATARQVEVVAAYLATGSEKAAASILGIAQRTVEYHIANARSATGAANMAQLVWYLEPRLRGHAGTVEKEQ